MANIVISRIQNRRGRRENLPQPLLPGEVALTSDTGQAWIGQDPALALASIVVYSNQLESTAQTIVDDNIVESQFDESFSSSNFNNDLVPYLTGTPNPAVVLTDNDILWDPTFRGTIVTATGSGGSGYTGGGVGVGDSITAISATGSGFVGWVDTTGGGGSIATVIVQSGGINYRSVNTTFTIAGGTGGTVSVTTTDIIGSTVLIAADQTIDAANTTANVILAVADGTNPVVAQVITSAVFDGTFTNSARLATNHTEAENAVTLINRVNASTPGQITGLVHTNLNVEITGGTSAGAVVLPYEAGYYFEGIVLAANALKALHVTTQAVTFASGVASEAYTNIVSTAEQVYDLQKNSVSFGSVTFAIGTAVGTVTIGSSTVFAKGDRLEVFGPASPDGTLDQISITLTGTITV
jgi:hypothetical protein